MSLGPSISLWAIEVAVMDTLETWLEQSLSLQDQIQFASAVVLPRPPAPALQPLDAAGNDPGDPTSIHGGLDTGTSDFDLMPEIIVEVQPEGQPTYFGSGDYSAEYALTITAQIYDISETRARAFAAMYGAAIDQTILQNGDLGGIASRTRLIQQAKLEFVDSANGDDTQLIQSVSTFQICVDAIVNDSDGLPAPLPADTLANPDSHVTPGGLSQANGFSVEIAVISDSASTDTADFDNALSFSDVL